MIAKFDGLDYHISLDQKNNEADLIGLTGLTAPLVGFRTGHAIGGNLSLRSGIGDSPVELSKGRQDVYVRLSRKAQEELKAGRPVEAYYDDSCNRILISLD